MALGARALGHTLLKLLAHGVGLGLVEAALNVGQHALEGLLQRAAAVAPVVVQL